MAKQYDAISIRNRLVEKLQSSTVWSTILIDGTNQRLFDTISEGIAELARYGEYLLTESKWSKAQNLSSLTKEAQILNYQAHRKIGAVGKVRISISETFDSTHTYNITIPKFTVFKGGGLKFSTITTEELTTIDDYIDVNVVQGYPRNFPTYVATGSTNEEIDIENENIENENYVLTVNDEEWTAVTELREYDGDAKVYKIINKTDFSGIYILFGDGIHGKKLESGDTVDFQYIETEGKEGDILSSGIIDKIDSTLSDSNGDVVDLYCTNTESIVGGDDIEDIEDIRALAPKVFAAGDRAVSSEDYKAIIDDNFTFVAKVNAWGAYETNIDAGLDPWTYIPTEENVVRLACVTADQQNLSDSQKLDISRIIQPKKAPTDILFFENVDFVYMIFNVDAKVRDRAFTLTQVRSNIFTTLSNTYNFEELDFFESIYESDYISLIDNVGGVDHHTTFIEFFKEITFNVAYQTSTITQLYTIEANSVKIYVRDNTDPEPEYVLVGIDDGEGLFTAQPGYTLTGSSVTYATGEVAVVVASGISGDFENFDVKVVYQTVNKNIRLLSRNQFLLFDDAEIVTSYT